MTVINTLPTHEVLPDMPSATNTDHDGRYYTESEIDGFTIKFDDFTADVYTITDSSIVLTNGGLTLGAGDLTLGGLTADRLVQTSGSKALASVLELDNFVQGSNNITTDDAGSGIVEVNGSLLFPYTGATGDATTGFDIILTAETSSPSLKFAKTNTSDTAEFVIDGTTLFSLNGSAGLVFKSPTVLLGDATNPWTSATITSTATNSIASFIGNLDITSPTTNFIGDVKITKVGNQLELEHDASNQAVFGVSSGGDLEIIASGGDFTLTDTTLNVTGPDGVGEGVAAPEVLNILGGTGGLAGSPPIGGGGSPISIFTGPGRAGFKSGGGGDWNEGTGDAGQGGSNSQAQGGDYDFSLGAGETPTSGSAGRAGNHSISGNDGGDATGGGNTSGAGTIIRLSPGSAGAAVSGAAAGLDGYVALGDGTNQLIIELDADTYWEGSGTGLPYGHMYVDGTQSIIVALTLNTPAEVEDDGTTSIEDGWLAGDLNLITFPTGGTEHHITITKAGVYRITWNLSFKMVTGAANTQIHAGLAVDSTTFVRDKCEAHRTISNNTDTGNMAGGCLIDLPNGNEELSLWMENTTNSNDAEVVHGSLVATMVGGT